MLLLSFLFADRLLFGRKFSIGCRLIRRPVPNKKNDSSSTGKAVPQPQNPPDIIVRKRCVDGHIRPVAANTPERALNTLSSVNFDAQPKVDGTGLIVEWRTIKHPVSDQPDRRNDKNKEVMTWEDFTFTYKGDEQDSVPEQRDEMARDEEAIYATPEDYERSEKYIRQAAAGKAST